MGSRDIPTGPRQATLRSLAARRLQLIALVPMLLLASAFSWIEARRLYMLERDRLQQSADATAQAGARLLAATERTLTIEAEELVVENCLAGECLARELARLRNAHPALLAASATAADGTLLGVSVAAQLQDSELAAPSRQLDAVRAQRRPVRTRLAPAVGAGADPLLAIAVPLIGGDGSVRGALEVVLCFGTGPEFSRTLGVEPKGSELGLVDRDGLVLGASTTALAPGSTLPQTLRTALEQAGELWRGEDGTRMLLAQARIADSDWQALARGPLSEAYRHLTPFLVALAAALSLSTLLIGIVARRAASALAGPMEQIVRELERIDPEQPDSASSLSAGVRAGATELSRIGDALDGLLARLARTKAAQIDALNATEEANLKLAAIIDERDRHIEEQTAQLRKALSDAQDAARAKDQLLANTSHEIRTPLNGVIGTAELLLRRQLAPEDKHSVETILRCAEGLLQLINDILDLTRLRNDTLALGRERFDLRAEITSVVDALKPMAEQRDLTLESRFEPSLESARMGDPLRLRQVLLNLVSNAVKFTEHGYVRVSVAPRDGDLVRLTVEDTGIGIRPEHIERIFDPFVQVDSTMSRWSQGTGLGLTISRQLVALMGGTLSVESAFGQGSKFTILLPLEVASDQAAPAPAPVISGEQRLAKYRMLVVDDVEVNRDVLVSQLATLGIKADGVDDGFEALEYLLTHPCDVVLLDCQMPGMDGYEVSRRIRKRWPGRRLHVIAVTAHAMPSERQRCLDAGMDEYLAKPVRLKALREVLERVVLGSAGAEAPPAA
jgi:signal transduction histidine kinase/ActR/RegA family two-component response regulator